MKLSDLKTGETGIIVKVQGHGGFRKRIIEMGFVKGKQVEVLLNAPLHDPVKYKIMGYEVSLRHQEAAMIEVVASTSVAADAAVVKELLKNDTQTEKMVVEADDCEKADLLKQHVHEALRQRRTINVALIGNPNCGKTSLFNYASGAHGHVGNYSGVTVDASEAHASMYGYEFNLVDLPGTYSLSCYSPEELYVRKYLNEKLPDVVINVIDSTNLERNLYLTTQLVDMDMRLVGAFNMYDEFVKRGDNVDLTTLGTLFGMPIVPTSFKTGMGVKDLFKVIIQVYEGKNKIARHLHINYGHEIEDGIKHLQKYLKADEHITQSYSTRYLAIKLLENDHDVEHYVGQHMNDENRPEDRKQLNAARSYAASRVLEETGTDAETAIMDAKYGFINGALTEAGYTTGSKNDTYKATHIIDNVLSHKYFGFPIFFLILYVMFHTTFSLGQYPMDWIEAFVAWLGDWVGRTMPEGPLRSLVVDGAIAGVGSVVVFLPQILILYFFISLMEDSGYMARAAFIMDRLMHKMGLHGKSFIPLIMGFGCNVPAVMATRTIESRRSRLITMMILPFMSCSARLPIYIMIVGTFFSVQYRSWVMLSIYMVGIVMSVIVSKLMATFVIKGSDTPFVMELPPYRWPTAKAIGRHTWEKGKEYLKKMGGVILVASIIVWALGYFPHDDSLSTQQQQEHSYIGKIGKTIEPVFAPQGFNWKLDVSLVTGIGAKEIVASTIGVLYSGDDSFADDDSFSDDADRYTTLGELMRKDGMTPLTAYCYLLFILLYFPCVATIVAIKNETSSWRWALIAACYTTLIAWVVSATVYQVGQLF
ncbi:ferrous iron transport protein B [Prevotella sp. E13-27]|uniref:ferrous iron transport protein B n=1 Tax=Prevotella sp. E13-27 TaxID=2938122 RepID=UPI00200ACBF9|nr:ferrous iron transport protein B [Prevotella sp. E13-27]MCK8623424.1 ferrous iron transport protein B [Prevotella sp. E13-27]